MRHSLRSTARGLLVPLGAAVLLAGLCLWLAPTQPGTGADHAAGHWLHLPGILLVAAALAAALESWPLFSRDRPGSAWVARVERGPLHGCLAAASGSMVALAAALLVAAVGFVAATSWAGVEIGGTYERLRVTPLQRSPYLDRRQETLGFRVAAGQPIGRVRLRPAAIFGPDPAPCNVQVRVDGDLLHPDTPWLANAGELLEFAVTPPRAVRTLQVRRRVGGDGSAGGGVVLRLYPERIEVIAQAPRSSLWNGVAALLIYLAPALLAFAVMILGHRHLALPVNFAAGFGTTLLAVLLELTPNSAAITAFARGRWLWAEPGLWEPLGLAVAGAAAMVAIAWLAARIPRRRR